MVSTSFLRKVPLSTALIDSVFSDYSGTKLRKDLIAGLVVSLVALPLSMALSIAVGLPPQHGLYTAIIAGIVTALFGGSRTQVSGPTAAFVVILAPIVAEYGIRGIVWCQILAGLMLLLLGVTRLGRVITFVPYPVTAGFTAGIAVVIGTIALNDFLGINASTAGHWPEKVAAIADHITETNFINLAVGMLALLIMTGLPRFAPKLPSALVGISVATGLSVLLAHSGHDLATIGSRFHYVGADGLNHGGIPPIPPSLHIPGLSSDAIYALPTMKEISIWFIPSLVIAALAALESLLSATVADSMSGTRHDPNAELNGIGLGNMFSALFLGIPATGAIARTATNINAGAVSPLASIFHAFLLLLYMILLAPLISYIPMTALSALLLVTAWRMSHAKHFVHLIKTAPRSDMSVALVCFTLTVAIDMVAGVVVGVVVAILLFLKRMIEATHVAVHHHLDEGSDYKLPPHTLLYRIDGPLFFGTVNHAFEQRDAHITDRAFNHIILDLEFVPMMDVTAIDACEAMIKEMMAAQKTVIIVLSRKNHNRMIRRLGADMIAQMRFAASVEDAIRLISAEE